MTDTRPPRLPDDPVAFVARAEHATNTNDTTWPMTIYAPSIRLETIGDGVHDVYDGAHAVRPALEDLYQWFALIDAQITKTLIATSEDTLVNTWHGTLFGGRQRTYGAEFWRFNEDGQVVHNMLYTSINPKPGNSVAGAIRMLIGHPRPTWAYIKVRARRGRKKQLPAAVGSHSRWRSSHLRGVKMADAP